MTKTLDFDGCDFGSVGELVYFMEKVQRICNIEDGELYGTIKGILVQLKQFNIPEDMRDKDEVMIVYYVPKFDGEESELHPKKQWFDKNTKEAVDEPSWFVDRMKKLNEAAEKLKN